MKKEQQTIDQLLKKFTDYLRSQGRRPLTIKNYSETWLKVREFMASNQIQFYNKSVEEHYLKSVFGIFDDSLLSKRHKFIVNRVESLYEFQTAGPVPKIKTNRKLVRVFSGSIGKAMLNYIEHKQLTVGLLDKTVTNYEIYLYDLLLYLNNKNVNALDEIKKSDIIEYHYCFDII